MSARNLLVAHGGGPTAVMNASLAGTVAEAQRQGAVDRIFAARRGIEGVVANDLVELTSMSGAELERLSQTPATAIGSCRHKVTEADFALVAATLRTNGIGYFLYNGGNDSMDTCLKLSERMDDIAVAGIPKTIDNDLAGTDHSPGFGSAARYYAVSTAELCLDVRALSIHVSVLEIMGRNAGWLCAAATLAGEAGPDAPRFVLVPERPLDEERFLASVEKEWSRSQGFVVVVSEGMVSAGGRELGAEGGVESVDSFGHRLPGGAAAYLAALIRTRLGIRSRSEKPGLLGRASAVLVSDTDRLEAREAGAAAVRELSTGNHGFMIGFRRVSNKPYSVQTVRVPLSDVANVERKLPDGYIGDDGMSITPKFAEYCRPLLGPSPYPDYFVLR